MELDEFKALAFDISSLKFLFIDYHSVAALEEAVTVGNFELAKWITKERQRLANMNTYSPTHPTYGPTSPSYSPYSPVGSVQDEDQQDVLQFAPPTPPPQQSAVHVPVALPTISSQPIRRNNNNDDNDDVEITAVSKSTTTNSTTSSSTKRKLNDAEEHGASEKKSKKGANMFGKQ
jgi:hypothetical protein